MRGGEFVASNVMGNVVKRVALERIRKRGFNLDDLLFDGTPGVVVYAYDLQCPRHSSIIESI